MSHVYSGQFCLLFLIAINSKIKKIFVENEQIVVQNENSIIAVD